MRGKAVRVLHIFGDLLCMKWNRGHPLNEGFTLSRIHPIRINGAIDTNDNADNHVAVIDSQDVDDKLKSDDTTIIINESASNSIIISAENADNSQRLETEAQIGAGFEISEHEGKLSDQPTVCDTVEAPILQLDVQMDSIDLSGIIIEDSDDVNELSAEAVMETIADSSAQRTTDLVLEACLLRALYYIVKDRGLPLLSSTFWLIVMR